MPEMTARKHRLLPRPRIHKYYRQTIFLTVCCCCCCVCSVCDFPPYNSHISLPLSLSLSQTWSQSQLNCPPSTFSSLSDAPILHIAHVSPLHTLPSPLFISCVSATSPPCGPHINYTTEAWDNISRQTHLLCSPQRCLPFMSVGNQDVQKVREGRRRWAGERCSARTKWHCKKSKTSICPRAPTGT